MATAWSGRRRAGVPKVVAIVIALALVGAACTGDDGSDAAESDAAGAEAPGPPQHGGELTIGLESESNSFLPGQGAWSQSAYNIAYAIFDPLVVRNADGEHQPYLAESVESNDDLTEWRVTLRPGVQFHDGTELDAEVLKTIFDEYLRADGAIVPGPLGNVTELRVDAPLIATYVLEEPDGGFPDLLAEVAGMPFSVEAARAAGADAGLRPVGTGPFQLVEWSRDDRLVVERNPNYWREGLPYLDRITFRPIPDERSRVQALLTGVVDAMQTLRGATVRELVENEDQGFTAHMTIGDEAGISVMNVLEPPFDDLRIRKAFSHTIDQEQVAQVLGEDGLVPTATQYFGVDSPWYSERVAAARYSHDPEEARRLVTEYVNDPDRSDGAPVGQRPKLRYGCLEDPTLIQLSQITEVSAEAAGFDVDLVTVDQEVLVAQTTGDPDSDPPFRGDFMVNCYRILPVGGPAATFGAIHGPPAISPGNLSNFHRPELEQLIGELRRTGEFEAQKLLVEQIGILINEAAPVTYGVATPAVVGVRDEVRNVDGWTFPDGTPGTGARRAIARWGEVWLDE